MHNLLSQGHDMDYIARHYNMDLPLCASAPLNLFFHIRKLRKKRFLRLLVTTLDSLAKSLLPLDRSPSN